MSASLPLLYLIGALKNPRVPQLAVRLRAEGWSVFDDWFSPGREADEEWRRYEKARGRTFREALNGAHAVNAFNFDLRHMHMARVGVLVMPAGKSGHLELGYLIGRGLPGFVLFDGEPERYDLMYRFATAVTFSEEELIDALKQRVH